MASLTDEIRDDIQAGGALADATAEGLAQEYAAQIAAAPTAEAAGDRYLAIRTTYRSRGLGVPAPVIEAIRARDAVEAEAMEGRVCPNCGDERAPTDDRYCKACMDEAD